MEFISLLRQYEQDVLRDICELVKIPSVADRQSAGEGAPFGQEVARALDWYLNRASEMGFAVKNVGGYAGHVEYGEGEELLGVLVHLDVVPPGPGWQSDPFGAAMDGEKIVGRGVVDDKGPAVISLYALKALQESGVALTKRIRIIAGTDEENGMHCVEHYFQQEEKPTLGFSPDGDFPLIYAEKGLLHLKVSWQGQGPLQSLHGGERPNIVPQVAEARVRLEDLPPDWERLLLQEKDLSAEAEEGVLKIRAQGRSAHASVPEQGRNALVPLLESLCSLELQEQQKPLQFLSRLGRGINGEGLEISFADEISGKLTCNLGMLRFSSGQGEAVIDIRSPVSVKLEEVLEAARKALLGAGFDVEVLEFDPPHYLSKDSGLVRSLLAVYRDVTGDTQDAMAIGGATYARKLDKGVAFGPLLPGREDVAHTANEYILLQDVKVCLEIYARAMYKLAGRSHPAKS